MSAEAGLPVQDRGRGVAHVVEQRFCFMVASVEECVRVFLKGFEPRPRILAVELRGCRCVNHAASVRRCYGFRRSA